MEGGIYQATPVAVVLLSISCVFFLKEYWLRCRVVAALCSSDILRFRLA